MTLLCRRLYELAVWRGFGAACVRIVPCTMTFISRFSLTLDSPASLIPARVKQNFLLIAASWYALLLVPLLFTQETSYEVGPVVVVVEGEGARLVIGADHTSMVHCCFKRVTCHP